MDTLEVVAISTPDLHPLRTLFRTYITFLSFDYPVLW
jgi:hypothetical protein